MLPALTTAISLIFPIGCILAIYWDFTRYEIPNSLSIVVAAGFLPYGLLSGLSWSEIGFHYLYGVVALGIGFILFALRVFGGGDGKFIAATVVWFSTKNILPFVLGTTLFGGILAIILLVFRLMPVPESVLSRPVIAALHDKNNGIPYGVAIGAAGLVMFVQYLLP